MYGIENDHLRIQVNSRGAELYSIYSKKAGLEYLWNGDAAYWNKRSPVLFPIVGALKNNTYYYANKAYKLPRNGFAREMDFELAHQTRDSLTFTLKSNEATLVNYPFEFRLDIV